MAKDYIRREECVYFENIVLNGNNIMQLDVSKSVANKVVLQFYTNPAGIAVIDENKLGYTPIAMICENGEDPEQLFTSTKGQAILNFGVYVVEGRLNLRNTKMIAFNNGYDVFVKASYFK
jgi:hypothetical protein